MAKTTVQPSIGKEPVSELNVAIVGFGNVGSGIVDILHNRKAAGLHLAKVVVKNPNKPRSLRIADHLITTDIRAVIEDPQINILVELIGGVETAEKIVVEALRHGKDVVTANKALIAKEGHKIFSLASEQNRCVGFRGTFVGCHALIHELSQSTLGRRVASLHAILSGTCNYVLSSMSKYDKDFQEALGEAQEKGYAEPDPKGDIDGTDTADKLSILFRLMTNSHELEEFPVEGIENMAPEDVKYAQELGYAIKLIGIIEEKDDRYYMGVHPALLPKRSLLGALENAYNGIELTDEYGITSAFCAPGAGTYATAGAILRDLIDIAENGKVPMPNSENHTRLGSFLDLVRRYYLRLSLVDKTGTLGKICNIFAEHNISIAAVHQKEAKSTEFVPVVMTTHSARESDVQAAIARVNTLDIVRAKTRLIRIVESGASS